MVTASVESLTGPNAEAPDAPIPLSYKGLLAIATVPYTLKFGPFGAVGRQEYRLQMGGPEQSLRHPSNPNILMKR
ncbi:MAG: hypothetical protein NVS1B11_04600 [Terriglobales bacterium]